MKNKLDLAELIFGDIKESVADLEKRFSEREISKDSYVTRFAPSPTGFLHTGSLFTAFIGYKLAHDSDGVFYFRLEDTDTKREVEGSAKELLEQLQLFGITPDEGLTVNGEVGQYGPYTQSKRENIYKIVIKEMIAKGIAYPCFCSKEELETLRNEQEKNKEITGYYGKYATCRNLSADVAYNRIVAGEPYVIRFKSTGDHNNKILVHDEIRGDLELAQNDQDIIILKSDNLPTYHFAHAVDDHFMHTTLVTRGEEWLSSLPIHVELFDALGFSRVKYAHLPVIMKLDNGNKRKLSKRKDDEAAVSYFLKDGYPIEAILTYLMSIANSNFEEYLIENPHESYKSFIFNLNKMSLDGALFDIEKLRYFSKEFLAKLNKNEITKRMLTYTNKFDQEFYLRIKENEQFFKDIINIEREKENPRKDYACLGEIYEGIKFFYNDVFGELVSSVEFNPKIKKETLIAFLNDVKVNLSFDHDEQEWFASLKAIAVKYGFNPNNKEYKLNPEAYTGNIADAAEIVRIAVTTRKQTPNLFAILNILGTKEVNRRIDLVISKI
ncbi:MAG: glutamate--tRNA ligase [Bacilli bacterium]